MIEKKIYYINPVFEAKYWGGQALKKRYGYEPDLPNIAIAYHVIALPQYRGNTFAVLRKSPGAIWMQPGRFSNQNGIRK